jgi:glycosyltransferase involved in cell wall biosynthesis
MEGFIFMISEKKTITCTNDFATTISKATRPLVTIGITNYNGDDYLDQCITSILHQSIKSMEIIIVDDNSQDNSIEKIKKLQGQYENISAIFHNENSGSPDLGRQEIITSANGSYLMLVDSDDYFAENVTIERLLDEFENSPEIDYVYCNMLVVDKSSKQTGLWAYKQYSDEELIHDTFHRGGSGVIPMKGMFKKDFFIKNSLAWHSNETAGDTLSALIYTKHDWRYKHLNLNLLCYRQYGESFTFNLEKRIKSLITVLEYIIDNFSEEIYFSKIPWKQYNAINRREVKMNLLGNFYCAMLKTYYQQLSSWSQVNNQKEQNVIEALTPLKNQMLFYLSK